MTNMELRQINWTVLRYWEHIAPKEVVVDIINHHNDLAQITHHATHEHPQDLC